MLRPLLFGSLAATLVVCGCDSSASPAPAPAPKATSDGAPPASVVTASTTTALAYQAMFDQASPDAANPMGSSKASLVSANQSLHQTWASDPSDSRTAFALAVTSLSVKMNDLAGTFDRARNNGLPLGGGQGAAVASNPGGLPATLPALARAMATPAKAPLVHEIQDSVETLLMPVLDSAIQLLDVAWSDPGFEFRVAFDPANFPEDTLILDRVDAGMALSILQGFRAQLRWLVSYNLDIDQAGSYAWADTLGNWDPETAAISPAQDLALTHFKSLFAPGSSFLKVRPAKASLLASVPVEFRAALARARQATDLAAGLKSQKRHLPYLSTAKQRSDFATVLDTASRLLSGPVTTTLYSKITCRDTSWSTSTWNGQASGSGYSDTWTSTRVSLFGLFDEGCSSDYDDVWYSFDSSYVSEYHRRSTVLGRTSQTVVLDISRLISLPDLKVFLPVYQWNATEVWKTKGPLSLVGTGSLVTPLSDLEGVADTLGFDGVKARLTWADPSFGGVFPNLRTSGDVIELFRKAVVEDGANPAVAARSPLALF